ncbi:MULTISPECIES: TetR/AcrR family transcriptional regulator [unclassified Streptomyces]|uniref:TetR/AcrR family transcriptional regulator n=1 Tax=unclassified Streptomyces TaxID=2593676 RepID=UPI000AAA0358|nr:MULTISPECIES: TetR/AcrR family transcriptional regulator [unclassified Streptomyces]
MSLPDKSAADVPTHPQRKRQARGERRVAQIVDAAEALIADAGVQAVGMNALARHAGISPGSLYQYFPGKDAVIAEVARRLAARLQQGFALCSSAQSAPETTVDRLLEAAAVLARKHPALSALLTPTEESEEAEPNALFKTIARSLPTFDVGYNVDVTRDLAVRIFCTGLGLAIHQPDPAVLFRPTRQAVLSALRTAEAP